MLIRNRKILSMSKKDLSTKKKKKKKKFCSEWNCEDVATNATLMPTL